MNNYHKNNPDPEVRAKYASWKEAVDNRMARLQGFSDYSEKEKADEKKSKAKEDSKSVRHMLRAIGNNVAYSLATAHLSKKAPDRKSGRRGSRRGS